MTVIRTVSIIGKNDEIVYFNILNRKFRNQMEEINFQRIVYACLDNIDDNSQEIVFTIDKYKVLGYVSCTRTKVIVICEEYLSSTSTEMVATNEREFLFSIYNLYCNTCLNPFHDSTQTVLTKFSDGLIRLIMSSDFTK